MKRIVFALAILVTATLAVAQQGLKDWQAHISIPVTVNDKSGQHVEGLATSDFEVSGPKGGKYVEAREVLPTVMQNGKKPVVMLYDTLGTPVSMQNPARSAILRYIGHATSEGQPVHLFEITEKGGRLVHSSGTPAAVTFAALQKLDKETRLFEGHFDFKYDEAQAKQMSSDVNAEYNRLKAFYKEVHTTSTLQLLGAQLTALQSIGAALAPVPGHKALLFFSSYLPLEVDQGHQLMAVLGNFTEDTPEARELSITYEKATRLLNNAATSVFPVILDRTGLRVAGGQEGRDTFTGFNDLAFRTGGQVVGYDTAIAPTIELVQKECQGYYLLDYDVPQTSHIEWHGIGVKVDKPNLTVHKPDGIFTIPPQKTK